MTKTLNPEKAQPSDVIALLKTRVDELPENDRPFAYSLLGAAAGRGLSEKQLKWVRTMAGRIINPVAQPTAIEIGDVKGLVALFDKARQSGLQWPKLRALAGDLPISIRLAGEKSKHVGDLMVTSGKQESRIYWGRVDRAGMFVPSQQGDDRGRKAVAASIKALASDPVAAGKAYGKRTGHCAFCSLPLDDGRSIAAGYGPVCAENFGLPWGASKRRTAKGRG